MPTLHACPLSRLAETLTATGARHLVTFVSPGMSVDRPPGIDPRHHLILGVSDILAVRDGHVLADATHVAGFLDFVRAWPRTAPLLIHCYAGISRSTAAIYAAACALAPERDEAGLAQALRDAAPSATPNRRIVAIADDLLGRGGRMDAAVAAIGRGAEAFEGTPFHLAAVGPPAPCLERP